MKINLVDTINYVRKYKPNGKKIIRTTNLKYNLFRFSFGAMFILCAFLYLRCTILEKRNNVVETTLASISGENISDLSSKDLIEKTTEIKEDYAYAQTLVTTNSKLNTKLGNLIAGIVELDKENVQLVESNNAYYNELKELRERKELYDKYDYVLEYNNERTDITYDQLKTGIQICEQSGVDPALLFAFIMTESHGDETAKNENSTAKGYGQLLNGTATYVYEVVMSNGEGTYNTSMALNGDTNIEMTANYLAYLKENCSSVNEIITAYSGEDNQEYKNEINKWLAKADISIADLNNEMY